MSIKSRCDRKFVKDQFNVSHDSLMHACSLSANSFDKKSTFLVITILMFFACMCSKSLYRDES